MSRRRMRGAVAVVLLALVAATTTLAVPPAAAEDVAPTITLQPEATFSIPGTPGVLTADASPYTSVTWQYRGIGNSSWLESGADTATWAPAFGFSYEARAVFTNGAASTLTDAVPVHYYGVPTISTHPQPISRAPGQAGSFTASYLCNSCPGGMTGTWERSTDGGATWTSLVGGTFTSTQATYPIAAVSEADAGLYRVVLRNGPIPPVTSDAALLSVAQAPSVSITGSMEGPEGSERTLTAVVDAGHPAPALSWQRSTNFGVTYQDIPGATGATFTQTLTSDAHANRIRVRATNDFGVATSTAVLVRVGIVPTITSAPPASIGAADGEEIVLATAGTGEPTPTVLWRFKPAGSSTFATIAGATDPTYSFTLGAATAGTYQVEYSNRMGTATATTEVGVSSAGTVTVSPAARTRAVGQTATFTATATSAPAAVPSWERSLDGGTTWEATGTPGTTLSVVAAPELDQSQYRAVVTNASGTAVSNVAVLTVTSAPTVTTQPTARTVEIGAATTFTSVAVGAPAPTVQWQRSNDGGTTWADIPGATATTYVPETAAADDSSRYRAVFTNVSGSTTSNAVLLRVGVPTATLVADQPYFQWDFGPGGSAPDVGSLRASYSLSGVTGNPAPTIRWYYTASGCVPSSGCAGSITFGTGTSASIPAQSKGPIVRSYKVEVKNSLGTITVPITPLVAESPWVTTSPTSGVASPGSEVTFAAAATGTPTPTVQWERSEVGSSTWEDVPGATSTSLTVTVPSGGADPRYRARFANLAATRYTSIATLARDGATPTVSASLSSANPPAGGAYGGPVTVLLSAADDRAVESITWQASGAMASGPTTVTGDVAGLVVEAVGTTTVTYSARDEAGNVSAPQVVEVTIVGAPAAPSGVSAGLGDGSSVVSWSAPAPADVVTGYEITPVRDGVAEAVQVFGAGTSALVTGLVNGSSYRFSVVAVNAFGPGPARLSPVVTVGVPSHPSSLRSAAGNGSASLTWAPPPAMGVAPTGYEITPLLDGVTPLAPVTVGVVTAATVSGLANGSTYTFRIVTLSVNGPGLGATFPAVTVGVPLHPSGLKASPGNAVANLSWTAPPAMGVAPTGYEITPLLDGVTPLAPVTVGAVTSTTITGLGNGVTYGFEIVTLSPFGRSAPVSFPLVTVGVLNPPTTLRTTSGNGQATLTWVEPVTVGIAVTGYRITPVKGGVLQAPVDIGPGTSTTITGLTNGSVYAFRVVALSTYGTSANATFPAVTIGVPGNPTGLSAVAGDGQATVSWTAPADIGVPVTGYRVTPYIGSTAQTPTTTSGPGTTATVTGLANGTSYTFRVVTLSAFGESGYAKSMAVKIGTLGAPKLPRATSGNEQATLTWQPPTDTGIPVAGYRITPYLGAVQLAPTTVGPVTSTTITDLANGSTYTFRVEALSTGGTGTAAIAPAVTIGVPTFPSTLRSYPGDGEADLTWIAPPDIGVAVTGYRITPYIAGVAQPDITVGPVTATTVTGLTNGTTYTFRIATLTEHGASTTAKFPDVTPTAPT